ncbi:MAG: ribose-5-phosphate isomerase RpiA [Gammaproteobacteria bacterium]|nr:ribose-5-phosphate isomerase RpiA [Gammaproteobacteria bacterium]MDH5591903.1 ribose-5-phosphate isomerase RpiA [Gammaproteobacteria bacterium]
MTEVLNEKKSVAIHAANLVENGMIVGLGTGSTANYFIEELARKKREQGLKITTVASSVVSTIKAQKAGLELMAIEHVTNLDLYVDGADEVTPDLTLLKGRGFDLVKEKLLAKACQKMIVMVDQSKLVDRIGQNFPIPVEVMPFAWQLVQKSLQDVGGHGELRSNSSGDGLAITSHGSLVLDMTFDDQYDVANLNALLNAIPGVVEHGIFEQLASLVLIGSHDQVEQRWVKPDQ